MMKCTFLLPSLIFLAATVGAQSSIPPSSTTVVRGHRPLMYALEILERKCGWLITYEDPVWQFAGDIEQIGSPPRAGLRRILVPRAGTLEMPALPGPADEEPDRFALLARLFQAYEQAGNPGFFRVVDEGGILHVLPAFSRDARGQKTAVVPLLDTPIHIPIPETTPSLAIRAILDQVERARGVPIISELGSRFDRAVFGPVQVRVDARGQTARSLLLKILKESNQSWTWRLLCSPSVPDEPGECVWNLRSTTAH